MAAESSAGPSAAEQSLRSRRSVPALQLCEPGPSSEQIERAIDAALRVPDHGALKPWRFVLIRGEARTSLAALFVRRMLERDPVTPPGKLEKARRMPLCAPLVIAAAARIVTPHKVPEVEQLLAGGAGIMNLLNVFHAQGYGAIWLTGGNAYDSQISQALQLAADERLLGFIYVGSIAAGLGLAPRPIDRSGAVRDWSG
jgi:nitroreductase